MLCAHITIIGFVQGVGYRKFVRQQAKKLGLVGWVQNMPDGSVEAKAFGTKEAIEQLVTACKKGVFLAEVKDVQVVWLDEDIPPADFSILHS